MKKKPNTDKTDARAPRIRNEKDPDDLVHSTSTDIPTEKGEEDPDDLVHQPQHSTGGNVDESLADPDDLVHGPTDMEDEPR